MKTISRFRIWFLSILIISDYGCHGQSLNSIHKSKSDREKQNLKGDVVVLSDDYYMTFFNTKGMIEKELFEGGGISWGKTYSYTNDKLEGSVVDGQGFHIKSTFYYDENGKLKSSEDITKFDGDTAKSIETHVYEFNQDGNQILDSINDVRFQKSYYSGDILDSIVTSYGKEIYLRGNTDTMILYNEGDQTIPAVTTFRYLYDANGNWIKQKKFVNGKEDKVINRTIIYKGDDISFYEKRYNDFRVSLTPNNNSNTQSSQSKSNSTTNLYKQPVQKQWVNCKDCNGQGIRICTNCTGRGSMKCDDCFGRGWKMNGTEKQTCNTCGGTGEKKCSSCNGKGNRGTCSTCGGRGQVQL
jgi:hypothetical protein